MKKRFLSIALAGALAATALVGCGKSDGGNKESKPSAGNDTKTEAKGSVYYLNFKPEQDDEYQAIAKKYEEETGVKVTVVTAASGTYESKLAAEIQKTNAPTLFQVNGPVGLANWKDYCYDLKDTKVYGELTNESYALTEDGYVYGVGYVIESYGLITNTKLLEKAGYKTDDIQSFDDLKKVAEDITKRKEELGFSAFTSAGMDKSSDWRFKTHLANLPIYFEYQADKISSTAAIKGTYLDNYRNIFDLYINNSTCDPKELSSKTSEDTLNEFKEGKAVFYQNGSWEYGNVAKAFKDDELKMIPIYIGVGDEKNQGLCTGTENYWCVNAKASEADIKATEDFMAWLSTDDTALKAICGSQGAMPSGADGMGFVTPFKKNLESDNLLVNIASQYVADGKTPVSWNFTTMPSETWKNEVGSALTVYASDQTDANWDLVKKAFVEGWATESQAAGN